ncbi:hypothetical protein CEUSTIGMA_g13165.t1 [Chlamydomonas eustigma]|uniref:Uncharacterized protein n=1 Tax=Chlamydomonas eustigma TaxID=1157962 RepID=A0A250XSH1_9CHLO|nr:hypothetical protein CEUSTIGMA_g13165.t1 [Chlamydomonas eustigma]|eukprot:GAX85750.1 hypothetical protein CEUSTIGMA_g13165.t1 [Chlamydomonas eustigma]
MTYLCQQLENALTSLLIYFYFRPPEFILSWSQKLRSDFRTLLMKFIAKNKDSMRISAGQISLVPKLKTALGENLGGLIFAEVQRILLGLHTPDDMIRMFEVFEELITLEKGVVHPASMFGLTLRRSCAEFQLLSYSEVVHLHVLMKQASSNNSSVENSQTFQQCKKEVTTLATLAHAANAASSAGNEGTPSKDGSCCNDAHVESTYQNLPHGEMKKDYTLVMAEVHSRVYDMLFGKVSSGSTCVESLHSSSLLSSSSFTSLAIAANTITTSSELFAAMPNHSFSEVIRFSLIAETDDNGMHEARKHSEGVPNFTLNREFSSHPPTAYEQVQHSLLCLSLMHTSLYPSEGAALQSAPTYAIRVA